MPALQRGKPAREQYTATILRHHGYKNNAPKPKYFIYKPHQGKEAAYINALRAVGYKPAIVEHTRALFVLYDLDCFRRRGTIERLHGRGLPIFMYPHAARPQVVWDGMHELWPHTRCSFVIAPGHEEVMRRYGYNLPIEVTGWTYCEIKEFQPLKEVKNILFGPIHPSSNGMMLEVDKDLNQKTYARLVDYCQQTGARLTVRHIKSLAANGLQPVAGVNYVDGATNLSIKEIEQADLVVGHQTFAYLAVARGKPVLMMGEDIPPRTILPGGDPVFVKSWEKYQDILQFPLDVLVGDLEKTIARAIKKNAKVMEWRERFIGEPFDPLKFSQKLESYL